MAIRAQVGIVFASLLAGAAEAASRMLMNVHIVAVLVVDVFVLYADGAREQRRKEEDCEREWAISDECSLATFCTLKTFEIKLF